MVVPEDKLYEVKELFAESLGTRQTVKQKAKVVVKIVAFEIAMGKVVQNRPKQT